MLYKLKRYDEAIACHNKAIEISPLFPKSWYNKKLALEVQLNRSMRNASLRKQPKDKSDSKRQDYGKGSGDDKGDGSLKVAIGRII
jgi:tetratricopeptide (TPR) repeat protein